MAQPAAALDQWEIDANARIEQHRKAPLSVKVVDQNGNPVTGATVNVDMQKHAYGFGSMIRETRLYDERNLTTTDAVNYRNAIGLFNKAVLPRGHKQVFWEDPVFRTKTEYATNYLTDRGLEVRGHAMVWSQPNRVPDRVWDALDASAYTANNNIPYNVQYAKNQITNYIADVGGHFKNQVKEWDVVNEPGAHPWLTREFNKAVTPAPASDQQAPVMLDWFNAAKAAVGPNAQLYINEYSAFEAGAYNAPAYKRAIQYLKDNNAPLGGIGLQAHFYDAGYANGLTPTGIYSKLNEYAAYGVPLQLTEVDIGGTGWGSSGKPTRAQFLHQLMKQTFSHASTEGVMMWGFWDTDKNESEAFLYDSNWNIKPEGQAWLDLVYRDWWTKLNGVTSDNGAFADRGFLGDYLATVQYGGQSFATNFSLDGSGGVVTVVVPEPGVAAAGLAGGFAALLLRRRWPRLAV
ncbi:MAG TPA: endo-1,4-beta-xylanase [Tepidisphaeraceae bacterium]|nr:endo-1,4-beta-xylanase [Tepidisphaeraceae bacterium]